MSWSFCFNKNNTQNTFASPTNPCRASTERTFCKSWQLQDPHLSTCQNTEPTQRQTHLEHHSNPEKRICKILILSKPPPTHLSSFESLDFDFAELPRAWLQRLHFNQKPLSELCVNRHFVSRNEILNFWIKERADQSESQRLIQKASAYEMKKKKKKKKKNSNTTKQTETSHDCAGGEKEQRRSREHGGAQHGGEQQLGHSAALGLEREGRTPIRSKHALT